MTLQSKRKRNETLEDRSGTTIPSHPEYTSTNHTSRSDEIRLRAYEIYLERGDLQGSELEDWLRAERELLSASQPKRTDLRSGESLNETT
jgi:Protein of unknown function (DUF2934)